MPKRLFWGEKSRGMAILYLVLTAFVILTMIVQIWIGSWENVFTCVLTLILFLIPTFVNKTLKITLPQTLEIIIICFIFAAEILGELNAFYEKISWWDTMLHALNGFLMAGIGFSMVDILNQSDRFRMQLSPFFVVLVAFCFSMTIGVLWEFFEFTMDCFTYTDMQKDHVVDVVSSVALDPTLSNKAVIITGIEDVIVKGAQLMQDGVPVEGGELALQLGGYLDIGLHDTMKDMMVNFVGAVAFSGVGFAYLHGRGKGTFAKRFIPQLQRKKEAPAPDIE